MLHAAGKQSVVRIGVLDIQGSVEEHVVALARNHIQAILVRMPDDMIDLHGLIIPGGESTTIGMLLNRFKLDTAIVNEVEKGMTVWGTCAGAILLAREVSGGTQVQSLRLMDIVIERNAYGRQVDSFETQIQFNNKQIPAVFIRAPKIKKIGKRVCVLSTYDGHIIAAIEDKIMITTFHPELTDDLTVYDYFIQLCKK